MTMELTVADQVTAGRELLSYVRDVSLREDEILAGLREETAQLPAGTAMQVLAEEGQLLSLLAGLIGARTVLEIGTFTGYSTLCLARALPPGGRVITCDITPRWAKIGRSYWERAGVADRIELMVGDATATLARLRDEGVTGTVDLAFIDADKTNYPRYYEDVLPLVRPGGLIVVDNTLFFGRVADPAAQDAETAAIRELNTLLRDDDRVDISMLPFADGITLARKR
ncbi:class I SAM-dependent methyltransferase [Kibdelosporangium persicum]|uniref:Hydroxy-malonyl-ACP O-methyltransferase n=1 Tax=Kibdelosporangium persicum TaxID=2698649 RepID=A0ABX2F5G9_9PSEU|nr:Hydroxy-malonyl-ACP O-methyltransferase [Kibdelosporangium persicum]